MKILAVVEDMQNPAWVSGRLQELLGELLNGFDLPTVVYQDLKRAEDSKDWSNGFDFLILDGGALHQSLVFREAARDCMIKNIPVAAVSTGETKFEFCFPEINYTEFIGAQRVGVPEESLIDGPTYVEWLKKQLVFNIRIGPAAEGWEGVLAELCRHQASKIAV